VTNAIEASRPLLEGAQHSLTVSLPDEPLCVDGDLVRLTQVFSNLLNNAAKYTPAGGRVSVALEQSAGEARLRIRDTGIGIPPALLEQVFDMFVQLDTSDELGAGGLGVGLTLARRLIELHGGRIEAHSEGAGRGSEFAVYLPLMSDANGETTATERSESSGEGVITSRVLVADDNADAAESLRMVLQSEGHEVQLAHNGLEALEVASVFRPHAALLDIGMPVIDGYEAARRLRALPHGQTIQLVALTGCGQQEDKRRAREAGFDAHLTKPFDPRVLLDLIASARAEHNAEHPLA
jgi:CheY-like chemotaxis protein